MTSASEAPLPCAGTNARLVVVNDPLTCAGANTLVIVVDALMAQVLAVSRASEVNAPQAHAGADSMNLVLAVDAPMTYAGTSSMASIVDAQTFSKTRRGLISRF